MSKTDMVAELHAQCLALDAMVGTLEMEEFKANRNEDQPKQDLLRAAIRHIDKAMQELLLAGMVIKGETK